MNPPIRNVDVLIVGGGPAGSSVAWALRHYGLKIAVLDKSQFPRNKICAGWVTPQVLQALDIDWRDYAREHVLQPIHGFRVGSIGADEVDVAYPNNEVPVSFGIRRCEFDNYLLSRAGAKLYLGEPLTSMRRSEERWIVNESISAQFIVGAGGHFCPVARNIGARLGNTERVVAAQEVEFQMDAVQSAACRLEGEHPAIYFCNDLKGYGWAFRKGEWLNIGIGREDNHRLSEHLQNFCKWLVETRRIPAQPSQRFQGHAYLLASHATRPLVGDSVMLVGDAAGLAYPQSGEGIRPAVESGLLAGQIIAQSRGNLTRVDLHRYGDLIANRFGQRSGGVLASHSSWLKTALARQLLRTRWFDRRIVINRWFLHRSLPALKLEIDAATMAA
ncbi:MAG: NAD(P)/FAD-dependent oxidoreductase [Gammaproteobacteria bacterium]